VCIEPGVAVLEFVKKNVPEPGTWALEIERTRLKPTPRETGTRGSL
jgi:hypothetical protein